MGYSTYYSHDFTSVSTMFNKICDGFAALGWTLEDTYTDNKVYSSQGVADDFLPAYVKVTEGVSSVTFTAYLFWNAGTNTGSCGSYSSDNEILWDSNNRPIWMYGSKDFILIFTGTNTSNVEDKYIVFGFIANLLNDNSTTLTSSATSGDDVSLAVVSSANFQITREYIIVGDSTSGRHPITVKSIPDSTHILVENLPVNYPLGATIGEHPCPFGISSGADHTLLYSIVDYHSNGTATGTSSQRMGAYDPFDTALIDPSPTRNEYLVYPTIWSCLETDYEYQVGYGGDKMLRAPTSVAETDYDNTFFVTNLASSGTATGGSSTTLVDTSQSWVVNALQGKILLISGSTGLGQSRVIVSNTGTTITINEAWFVSPVASSIYKVYDVVYRQNEKWAMEEKVGDYFAPDGDSVNFNTGQSRSPNGDNVNFNLNTLI